MPSEYYSRFVVQSPHPKAPYPRFSVKINVFSEPNNLDRSLKKDDNMEPDFKLPASLDISRKPYLASTFFFMATLVEVAHFLSIPSSPEGGLLLLSFVACIVVCCIPCWFYHSAEIKNAQGLVYCGKVSGFCALATSICAFTSFIFLVSSKSFSLIYLGLFFLLAISSILFASSARETLRFRIVTKQNTGFLSIIPRGMHSLPTKKATEQL